MTLDEIGIEEGTDKSSKFHDYLKRYEPHLAAWRDKAVCLLEMGVLSGQSMNMWARYFQHPDSKFIGVDPHDFGWRPKDARMIFIQGRQEDPDLVRQINETIRPQVLNIVIDDAGHFPQPQMDAFNNFWGALSYPGIYIIEDLHAAWMPAITPVGTKPITTRLYELVDEVQDFGQGECGAIRMAAPRSSISEVTFIKSSCIIKKK